MKKLKINWKNKEEVNQYFRDYRKRNHENTLLASRKYREKNRKLLAWKCKEYRINKILSANA